VGEAGLRFRAVAIRVVAFRSEPGVIGAEEQRQENHG
jgi:hypothetical protein